jgi:opacity protein-like surface antigen
MIRSRWWQSVGMGVLAVAFHAMTAAAQPARSANQWLAEAVPGRISSSEPAARQGLTPAQSAVDLPRIDLNGNIGWFNHQAGSGECCRWYNDSLWAGLEGGYYWTEHVKTEVGFSATTEGRAYSYSYEGAVTIGGERYQQWSQARVRTRRLTAVQVYQFRHNAWVHPFVGIGMNLVREQRREERHLSPLTAYTPGRDTLQVLTTHDNTLRASALAGVKGYVSARVFLRTDFALAFRERVDEVVLRFGFGVDF